VSEEEKEGKRPRDKEGQSVERTRSIKGRRVSGALRTIRWAFRERVHVGVEGRVWCNTDTILRFRRNERKRTRKGEPKSHSGLTRTEGEEGKVTARAQKVAEK